MKYYRLTDGLNRVGRLIPETDNPYNYIDNQDKDWYLSIYKYDENHKKIAEEKIKKDGYTRSKGVSGIEDVVTNKLVFDIDDEHDLDLAKNNTIKVINRLVDAGIKETDMKVSFSGNKGFSIIVNHDDELTPEQHRVIAEHFASDLNSDNNQRKKKFDTSIYNPSRIFRLDFTKHSESGLYKTPLTIPQIKKFSVEQIKEKCKEKKSPYFKEKIVKLPDTIKNLKVKATIESKKKENNTEVDYALDFTKKPYYLTDVKYALHKGYIPPTYGNTGMMILCATYKHVGFDKVDAYHMLKGINEKRSEIYGIEKRENDEIWTQVVSTVYNPNWKGGTYGNENDLIKLTCETFGITDKSTMVSIGQVRNRFLDFAENINKNVIKTGIKGLDDTIMITTGMMVGVLAAPSAGKTSLATKIVENLSKNDQNVLFLSLDMHDNLLYSRLLQRVSGLNIEKKLRSKIESDPNYDPEYSFTTDEELNEAFDNVDDIYKNVNFDFTRGCTIESIEENIRVNKSKHGENLKMVVVDYLEKVRGPFSDATANSGYVASRLSDLASTYDVAIVLLLQPQKSAGDPSEELLSMRKVKGASVIEQDCRVILTMWRPGFNPKMSADDKYASIAVVKNNMGPVTQIDFGWDGLKGEFNELSRPERDALDTLRSQIEEEKAEEKKDKGW